MAVTATIKSFLKSKHILVPDEWITACVEWVQSENPGLNTSNSRALNDLIYEQWLHADLTELGTCCLPFGLPQKKSTSVSGYFALQVNSLRDVGQPAYAQLQKVRQADNENAKVTAEKSHQPAWEPKPSRMLMMQLTDGTSVVQGMEYRTIPALTHNMKPGTKILISGNITSKRGLLLLSRENVTVLGGEVESLVVPNAMENILARKLGMNETEQPQEYEETAPTQVPPSQASQYYPSQLNATMNRSQNRRGGGHQTNNNRMQNAFSASGSGMDDMGDDDFLDADLEAALSQIESQASSTQSSSIGSQNGNVGHNSNNIQRASSSTRSAFNARSSNDHSRKGALVIDEDCEMDVDDAFFNDDFDEDVLLAESQARTQSSNTFSQQSTSSLRQPSTSSQGPSSQIRSISNQLAKAKSTRQPQAKQSNLKNFFTKACEESQKFCRKSSTSSNKTMDEGDFDVIHLDSDDTSHTLSSTQTQGSRLKKSSASEFKTPFRPPEGKLSAKQEVKRTTSDIVKQEPPFSYLCFLPERPAVRKDIVVKGFIMTLTSRLEQVEGKWRLTVIINDGTASCEVDIENQVLEDLIGMSVEEMNIKKAEARSNPTLKAQLGKAVGGCQRQLISLCSLLHISVSPGSTKPRLTAITSFESMSLQQLSKRVSLLCKT